MEKESLFLWLNMMFPLVFSIGPMNVLFASYGGQHGFKKTIPFMIGCDVITFLMSLAIGYGGLQLIQQYSGVLDILRYSGAAYLVYLAYTYYCSEPLPDFGKEQNPNQPTFLNGAILNLLNVKAIMLISIMFTSFLDVSIGSKNNVLLLSSLLLILALGCHSTWIYFGSWLTSRFTSESFYRAQNYIFTGMLLIVAIWLVIS